MQWSFIVPSDDEGASERRECKSCCERGGAARMQASSMRCGAARGGDSLVSNLIGSEVMSAAGAAGALALQ